MTDIAHLDFETYCELDIRKVGAYRYARHPSCEVLIARYLLPGMAGKPREWLPWRDAPPRDLMRWVEKHGGMGAHNAQFERCIWKYVLARQFPDIPVPEDDQWHCTAVQAAACGLPRSLEKALIALGSPVRKDTVGSKLIQVFCKPRKPTKANASTRIRPQDSPEQFRRFSEYCATDVLGEVELADNLPPLTALQRRMYALDLRMNDRGLPIDIPLVQRSLGIVRQLEDTLKARVKKLSGGIAATQVAKMRALLADRGLELENLQAATVRDVLLYRQDLDEVTRELLQLRVEAGKASTKKLVSMLAVADPYEHVAQGCFLLFGAHTGRYSGRLIQPQNFIRGLLKRHQRALVFQLLERGQALWFQLLYDRPIDSISQCMRGFIKAPDGFEFAVVDYSAIEARVLAWVCGEESQLRAFRAGVDVYKLMAVKLYGLASVDDVTDEQRRIAKNLVLGCGYQLGGKKFVEYAARQGIVVTEEFAVKAVRAYRDSVPAIKRAWKRVEELVAAAVNNPDDVYVGLRCRFYMEKHWLCVELPSGRCIRYPYARALPTERWGKPAWNISFKTEIKNMFLRETTYGGKLIENIVQGIAFDIMWHGMAQAERIGYPNHVTVHDELITLRARGTSDIQRLERAVCRMPGWATGLPLEAKGFICQRYEKG